MGESPRHESSFTWDVSLPKGGTSALGRRKPLGIVSVKSDERGEETLSVPAAVARRMAAGRKSGSVNPSSRNELLFLMGRVTDECVTLKVEELVAKRDYSSADLAERLRKDGFPSSTVDKAVTRAVGCHLVDNGRFADVFIRSKASQGWGRIKIERELERHGIEPSSVEGWPEGFLSEDSEDDAAFELASRRRLTGTRDFEKIVRFLCSRGYSVGVATRAARRVLSDVDNDD